MISLISSLCSALAFAAVPRGAQQAVKCEPQPQPQSREAQLPTKKQDPKRQSAIEQHLAASSQVQSANRAHSQGCFSSFTRRPCLQGDEAAACTTGAGAVLDEVPYVQAR